MAIIGARTKAVASNVRRDMVMITLLVGSMTLYAPHSQQRMSANDFARSTLARGEPYLCSGHLSICTATLRPLRVQLRAAMGREIVVPTHLIGLSGQAATQSLIDHLLGSPSVAFSIFLQRDTLPHSKPPLGVVPPPGGLAGADVVAFALRIPPCVQRCNMNARVYIHQPKRGQGRVPAFRPGSSRSPIHG